MKNPVYVSNSVQSESPAYYLDGNGDSQPITSSRTGAETNIMDMDKANRIIGMNPDGQSRRQMVDQSAIVPMNDVFTIGSPDGGRPYAQHPYNGYTNTKAAHDRWGIPPEITGTVANTVVYTSSSGEESNYPDGAGDNTEGNDFSVPDGLDTGTGTGDGDSTGGGDGGLIY